MEKDDRDYAKLAFEQWVAINVSGVLRGEITFNKFMDTDRLWRADYVIGNIIIEINGGQWGKPVTCDKCHKPVEQVGAGGRKWRVMSMGGRHTRAKSYEDDLRKHNMATRNGYFLLQYTYEQLRDQEYIQDFKSIMTNASKRKG